MTKNIQFRKSNQWKDSVAYIGLFLILLFIISLILSQAILSIIFLFSGLVILGRGKIITVNLEKRIITHKATLLKIPFGKNIVKVKSDDFNKLKISQYSEFAGRQFLVFSSSVQVREYQLDFSSSESLNTYRLISSENYKEVKEIATEIVNNWGYSINDEIQNKLRKNRIDREKRKLKKTKA